jgi:protein ImuB
MKLWLAVRCPGLPLELLTRGLDPVPPLVVCEDYQVLLASEAARAAGIHPGMRLATARTLCDDLHTAERDAGREERALYRLGERLLDITPRISVAPPDSLLLDIGACLRLFGGLDPLLDQVRARLADSGLSTRPGLGPTPLAARELTLRPLADSRACVFAESPEAAFRALLAEQPLSELHISGKLRQRLTAPGFRTLGEILELPRHTLGKRHGRAFLLWLERLLGERGDEREFLAPAERFRDEQEFPDPVDHTDGLIFPVHRLLEALAAHLRRRQESVSAIHWHFRPLKGPAQTLTVERAQPAHDVDTWLELTRRRLEHWRLDAPVLVLELESGPPLERAVGGGDLLTEPDARANRHELFDRLATLPGLSCITPRERDEPLPEAAERDLDPRQAPTAKPAPELPFDEPPLWLLHPPRPLPLQGEHLVWNNAELEWLPQERRYSSHWWRPDPPVREYRTVRHPAGFCCRVFRDRRSGQWYLEGFF